MSGTKFGTIILGVCLCTLSFVAVPPAIAASDKFILDQDFAGPGGSDLQPILLLLKDPRVELLGLTGVTGDEWVNKGIAQALRFLEISGHPEVPVYVGAQTPLINTAQRMVNWEKRYSTLSWKGAWNNSETDGTRADFDPSAVPQLAEGNPTIKPQQTSAVQFLIEQVHKYPHQVTIVSAGPATNIALAVRIDPTFASLVKKLVLTGAPKSDFDPASGKAVSQDAFNSIFDPEAAHIVLTAGFPSIIATGLVSDRVVVDDALVGAMKSRSPELTEYLTKNAWKGLPMWDEIATAIAIDPSLASRSASVRADVDISDGPERGQYIAYDDKSSPLGVGKINVVLDLDVEKFRNMFLEAVRR